MSCDCAETFPAVCGCMHPLPKYLLGNLDGGLSGRQFVFKGLSSCGERLGSVCVSACTGTCVFGGECYSVLPPMLLSVVSHIDQFHTLFFRLPAVSWLCVRMGAAALKC